MIIDTLVLSGASTKASTFVGVFRALFKQNVITPSLEGINHIICCSISMLLSVYLLLEIDISIIERCLMEGKFENILNIDDLHINNLFDSYGLFDNEILCSLIRNLLKEKINKDDITLQELYDIKPILLSVKCINISKSCVEYINKDTNPNLSISKLLKMTTCIPLMFCPVIYNDNYYVDGGLTGSYPVEFVSGNYLGVWVREKNHNNNKIDNIIDYLCKLTVIKPYNYELIDDKYTIICRSDLHFIEFNLSEQQKIELIESGYNSTIEHIEKYSITNDLLKTPSDLDTDPSEEAHNQE